MKAEKITSELLEQIVEELFDNLRGSATVYPTVKTDDIAKVLWKRHHVAIYKEVDVVRQKMKKWWQDKPKYHEPIYHQWVGKYAVCLESPMFKAYSVLDKESKRALITAYRDQSQFSIESDKGGPG